MNELTRKITTKLYPRAALIAYSGEDAAREYRYLELRPIDDDGCMGEAHPVTYEFMNALVADYTASHDGVPHGAVPSNLLSADVRKGSERYVWFNSPCRRMMYFRKDLGIENGEYNLPGVIYEVVGEHLNIYAYKGDQRPVKDTELFAAPFFNVSRASVCLGTARLDKPADPDYAGLLEFWEKKFWLTEFSHLGSAGNPTESNLVLVIKAARSKPFKLSELISMNMHLKDLLK